MELILSRTFDGLELESGFCKTFCVISVSKGRQVIESGKGGQTVLRGDFKPLENLKDCGNMVESDTRTNSIVSFGFLDELKSWNIEKDMMDFKGQTKWQQQ
jgi:hypothetical protein